MKESIKVFVYGTLMERRSNHFYLLGQKLLGISRLDRYTMYQVRSYPGIIQKDGKYVIGEVYEIDANTLKKLDRLEGEGTLYKRVKETIRMNGNMIKVYTYVWLGDIAGCREIESEDMPWVPTRERCF